MVRARALMADRRPLVRMWLRDRKVLWMKTRRMIMTVESKIKDAPRGAAFILFSRALMPGTYWLKWSVTHYEWTLSSPTLRLIFSVHSMTQGVSLHIPLLLINANAHDLFSTWVAHEWLIHSNWSITHDLFSTWLAESWIPSPIDIFERVRYIRTISSTWMVDSLKLEHHSRLV